MARVEDRTFICSAKEIDAGPDQQLVRPRRDAPDLERPVQGCHGGPHHVRRPLLHGPARLAHRPHRRGDHRLRLRRRQHAHHDPHGHGCPRGARRRRRVRPLPALGRRTRSQPGQQDVPWPCNAGQQVHRPLPRDPRDRLVRLGLRRQRPARQEVLRAAHRLGHGPRRRLDGRAHAHLEAHLPRGRHRATSPARSPRPAARPTSPCSSRPSTAGRSRRSATTSAG